MTGGLLRLPTNQKGARLNAFDPFVDENDHHHEIGLRRPGSNDELRNRDLEKPARRGGGHPQPPVDAYEPFFVLDPDNFFFAGSPSAAGLRGGRRLLAGSNLGPGSLSSASTADDKALLFWAYLPIVVGTLAVIVYKKSDNKSRRANAHTGTRESTMLDEEDEWLVFRE